MSSSGETHSEILSANKSFMSTFGQGDAAGMASLYTEGGQFLAPNMDFITGREALQQAFQGLMDMGVKGIKLETVEVEGYGDTASEVGKYTLSAEGGQVLDQGKYIVIWKQEDGQWRLHRDIFNSSLPAPTPG